MATRETGETRLGALEGDKKCQKRARKALPLLVRQAQAEQPINYTDLAFELGMPNPRNLNYVLGAIGNALLDLSEEWGQEIPPLQALVSNKETGLPGEGLAWFTPDADEYRIASRKQRRAIVTGMLVKVFVFPSWGKVLRHFSLKPAPRSPKFPSPTPRPKKGTGRGESPAHRRLKQFVAEHPNAVGLKGKWQQGVNECPLRSGDSLDVFFSKGSKRIGVEVKTGKASIDEIARGLFQCVKYLAVLEAEAMVEQERADCRCILAVEGVFPQELLGLKHTLAVEVVSGLAVG